MLATTHPNRRVHQVRLSAPSQDLLWRGQRLLEDALHTVSLPAAAESSQLLLIRYFNAGTIHSSQSAASLSLSLEQKLQQLSAIALPGTHPAAAGAPAVTFPDDLTAIAHFAHLLAMGQPLNAWFWPRLLPDWYPSQSKPDAVRTLLKHLARHAIAPLATATVISELKQRQSLWPLLAMLTPQDGDRLLSQSGWCVPTVSAAAGQNSDSTLSYLTHRSVVDWVSFARSLQWSMDDARTLWLTTVGLIADQPVLANTSEAIAIAHTHLHTAHLHRSTRPFSLQDTPGLVNNSPTLSPIGSSETISDSVNPAFDTATASSQASALSQSPTPFAPSADLHPTADTFTQQQSAQSTNTSSTLSAQSDLRTAPLSNPKTTFSGIQTDHAGLIYLLNLLQYLHLPKYLPKYDSPTFPHILLLYAAQRVGIPTDDPILAVCGNDDVRTMNDKAFRAYFITHHPSLITPLFAWYTALRTTLHRHTHLTLKSLITRPGLLALTPTHLDLTFALDQVDIRIRKAGLDLNPGWLPWFGRVVQFHFLSSHELSGELSGERRSGGAP